MDFRPKKKNGFSPRFSACARIKNFMLSVLQMSGICAGSRLSHLIVCGGYISSGPGREGLCRVEKKMNKQLV